MKKILFLSIFILLFIGSSSALWSGYDRVGQDLQPINTQTAATENLGSDSGKGNLLGIQPWMTAQDYANAATLNAKLSGYLQSAREHGWLSAKTVVVFPEYIGTWLIAANEKKSVYSAPQADAAMQTVALTHWPEFIYRLATAPAVADKAKWALFTLKSQAAAQAYEQVFGGLAQHYGITIVAGSIVLPQPELINGHLTVHPGGALNNISAVFGPDGHILAPLVIKVFPIEEELQFIAPGKSGDLPVFTTAAGKLGVLICADAWFPQNYAVLQKTGATLLAVPSFSAGNGMWSTRWGGYNGGKAPADIDTHDIGLISEGDAWMKYAMPVRAQSAAIEASLNVFLRGQLWDLGSDGATIHQSAQESGKAAILQGAVLTNLWLH